LDPAVLYNRIVVLVGVCIDDKEGKSGDIRNVDGEWILGLE